MDFVSKGSESGAGKAFATNIYAINAVVSLGKKRPGPGGSRHQ